MGLFMSSFTSLRRVMWPEPYGMSRVLSLNAFFGVLDDSLGVEAPSVQLQKCDLTPGQCDEW